jgi:hypothetical protein
VTHIQFRAGNIRNLRSPEGVYPSSFHLDAVLLEEARLRADGHADFLAEPQAAIRARFDLDDLRLDHLQPALRHVNVSVRRGRMSAEGEIESAPKRSMVNLREVTVRDAEVDYRYTTAAPTVERQVAEKAADTATRPSEQTGTLVEAKRVAIEDSVLGLVNETTDPHYRAFVTVETLQLRGFSNRRKKGPAALEMKGALMGSGRTSAEASFWPGRNGPNFDTDLRIEGTELRTLNDLLRAHGGFDVHSGVFSLYSEVTARDGEVTGYVKPLFRDLDVYHSAEDREKSLPRKVYEGIVGGAANVLENRSRDQVATKTELSGKTGDVRSSTLQVAFGLVRNAFFDAILPGLERARGVPKGEEE